MRVSFLSCCVAVSFVCSSCITAAVTAATGAASTAVGGSTGLAALGLGSLAGSGAPASLEGCTLVCTDSSTRAAATLAFPKGVESNLSYARTAEKTATVTCRAAAEQEVYHLTFTESKAGTYVCESTGADGSRTLSHGAFVLR